MEIITGVGRRRYWSSEEKVRLVGEVAERGVAEVARRYEVCRSLLYRWRRQMREGEPAATTAAAGHLHLDRKSCLEVVVLRGHAQDIRQLADRISTEWGVRLGDLRLIRDLGERA
ncbi:MAG: transposase [Solirubrobacterales bacterium]